jgi:carboxyl-terminal processing protease
MEKKKESSIYKSIMLVVVTALITCLTTTVVVYNSVSYGARTKQENNNVFGVIANGITNMFSKGNENATEIENKINEIDRKLSELYIGDIDTEKLVDGALKGYVDAVGDEYTEYLDKEDIKELLEEVDGSYVGIGVYISALQQSNEIIVVSVIPNSPAEKSGILAGDIIRKVDGVEYKGDKLTDASNHMRGTEGTDVKVTIFRDNEEKEITITRGKIEFDYVSSEVLEDNIGYIKILTFEGKCAKEFEEQYKELESKGIKALILDLRNNGGGLVDQSLEIADLFLPKDCISLIAKDKGNNEEITRTKREQVINVPVVVLVNENTASSSEILVAAIKENLNAKVIGQKTYGKGVIQGIYLLKDQETGLKVTIQEYLTPNRNKINKLGITPDYEIALPDEWKNKSVVDKQYDTQLNKAIELLK